MKRSVLRLAAVALAVGGLAIAPAAAAAPASLELPGSPAISAPVVTAPGSGTIITPQISFCEVAQWWIWCRR